MIQVRRLATAAGAVEPVTADELMVWARITDDAERATCDRLITVARTEVEMYTGHVLLAGTFAITQRAEYRIELPITPVTAITEVHSVDAFGVFTLIDPASYSYVLTVTPAMLRVTSDAYYTSAYEVQAEAGFASDQVPADLKQAVLDVALLHYQHRDDPELVERVRAFLTTLHHQYGIVQI